MVTNITVRHPATTERDRWIPGFNANDYRNVDLSPVPARFPNKNLPRTTQKAHMNLRKWIKKSDPTFTLASMTNLRHLRFIVFPRGRSEVNFCAYQAHQISTTKFRSTDLQISFLNLVRHREGSMVARKTNAEMEIHSPHPGPGRYFRTFQSWEDQWRRG